MKSFKYFILIFFFIGCTNKQEDKLYHPVKIHKLDTGLERELFRFAKEMSLSDSLLKSTIYTIEFFNENLYSLFTDKDTVLLLSIFSCEKKYTGYKGLMKINDNFVLIMDKNNIGQNFYNKNFIINIPLNKLKCINEKLLSTLVFKVNNNELVEWKP